MEFKIVESRTFDRLKQCLRELLERSNRLRPSSVQEDWWDNQDICRLLDISPRTLQTYRDKGLLPYSQVGHKCYYKVQDIEQFIEENRIETLNKNKP
ncbi:DNA-binding protein [Dysgonomonas sp. 521]|uniref:helix-turn-helix domain-containing protein n=1 Tax=Dysgonomonas sp. 521 TaxID=2302932 RepID=UPI0013D7F330|nr:helix-turn-helix domain-containing protein [Dysgonomonas sp. 521]NDV96438.1 DNA-binding protein [Dysgonomonas sp. 521]